MIASQVPIFEALIKGCKEVKIVTKDSEVPAGCGTEQISVQAIVHVPVKVSQELVISTVRAVFLPTQLSQGKIDAAQEIGRLEKKVTLANTNADKIKKLQGQDNYETALPENVRQKNADQVRRWFSVRSPTDFESATDHDASRSFLFSLSYAESKPRSRPCVWPLKSSRVLLKASCTAA